MKIKVFIVTYKNEYHLNHNIQTLVNSDLMQHQWEITVINNNTNFVLHEHFKDKVKVLHNTVRPDFSTGHLARDWNCALIHGFKNLLNPDADIVVHCQDDTAFEADWCAKIIRLHERFTFVQYGWGDNFCSYTVEAVKNIGLWDERFCNIGQQEADYLLRSLIYNREKSSINDDIHSRRHNPQDVKVISRPDHDKFDYHSDSTLTYNIYSDAVYIAKWNMAPAPWTQHLFNNLPKKSLIPNFVTYPYFEKDIYDLDGKGYILRSNVSVK